MSNGEYIELLTGLMFEVDFDDKITATNCLLNLEYEYDTSYYYGNKTYNAEDIDEKSIAVKFDCLECFYDIITITGKTLGKASCDMTKKTFEYNLRLQNSAIPFFINDSVDELYQSLVETKIEAYLKEKEQQSIINALNAELLSLRSNLLKSNT